MSSPPPQYEELFERPAQTLFRPGIDVYTGVSGEVLHFASKITWLLLNLPDPSDVRKRLEWYTNSYNCVTHYMYSMRKMLRNAPLSHFEWAYNYARLDDRIPRQDMCIIRTLCSAHRLWHLQDLDDANEEEPTDSDKGFRLLQRWNQSTSPEFVMDPQAGRKVLAAERMMLWALERSVVENLKSKLLELGVHRVKDTVADVFSMAVAIVEKVGDEKVIEDRKTVGDKKTDSDRGGS